MSPTKSKRSAVDLDAVEALAAKSEPAASRLRIVLPHIGAAADRARTEGTVGLGVISMWPDGGGRVTAQFEAEEFFVDLVTVSETEATTSALCAALREQDMLVDTLADALKKAHAEITAGKLDVAKNRIALALSLVEVPS